MNRLCYAMGTLALSAAVAACGDASDPVADLDADRNTTAFAEGTSGTTATPAAEEPQADPARDLPDTASPLALMAVIGGLSLGAAAGLRYLRHL